MSKKKNKKKKQILEKVALIVTILTGIITTIKNIIEMLK